MNKFPCLVAAVSTAILLAACATASNPALDGARTNYHSMKNDPDVARAAPDALQKAHENIDKAQSALQDGDDKATDHYVFLAKRQLEIANTKTQQAQLQEHVDSASKRRTEQQLQAQKQQALQSQAQADQARQRSTALQQQLAALEAKQTDRGMVLTLGNVLFDTDKAQLKPGAMGTINRLASFMQDHKERTVRIEGYTDSSGSSAYNQQLSQQRAMSVRNALVGQGVDPSRITAVGLGEDYPVATNETAAGRQQNRRVEVVISDKNGHVAPRQ